MPKRKSQKVFGIGFHKTGTTSLAMALELLGYKVTGPDGVNDPDIAITAYKNLEKIVNRFDAVQDNPWPLLFKELDLRYPGSKFVLTIRPPEKWLASVVRHFGEVETPMRKWIYGVGSPVGHEQIFLDRYNAHNVEVLEYFKDRPDDLVVLRLTEGEGWEKLCPFLGVSAPEVPFPRANDAASRENDTWFSRRLARPAKRYWKRMFS